MRQTEAEHRSLFLSCRDHSVATHCGEDFQFMQLAADPMAGEEALCPRCRRQLIEQVREHLNGCPAVLQNLINEAERHREQACHPPPCEAGEPLAYVQQQLGHHSPACTLARLRPPLAPGRPPGREPPGRRRGRVDPQLRRNLSDSHLSGHSPFH